MVEQEKIIEIVMRQTSYSFDEAKKYLDENNNDYMKVIKKSLGIAESKVVEKSTSINQQIYKEIRGFMDNGSKNYINTMNQYKKQQEIISLIKKEQQKQQKQQKQQEQKLEKLDEDEQVEQEQ